MGGRGEEPCRAQVSAPPARTTRSSLALLVGALALVAALAAGAGKAQGAGPKPIPERYVAIKGARGAGPELFDRVFVNKIGPPGASRVLVLVPGFIGGAGDFRLVARDIVSRVPDLQVWAVDRRSNALEDTSVFAGGDPDEAFDYYLRFQAVDGRRFQPLRRPGLSVHAPVGPRPRPA